MLFTPLRNKGQVGIDVEYMRSDFNVAYRVYHTTDLLHSPFYNTTKKITWMRQCTYM
jgi:hypothetical protein